LRQLSDIEKAYTALFSDSAHAVMVLRDLATQTGFMVALEIGTDPAVHFDHNARRAVFGRLYDILNLTASGRRAIAEALTPAQPEE
jgi:hypothetical protein